MRDSGANLEGKPLSNSNTTAVRIPRKTAIPTASRFDVIHLVIFVLCKDNHFNLWSKFQGAL